jgi:5,5'-dehydrodivanillate O-demethylase
MGVELRRSWHAIGVAGEITADHPIKPVRLLSEGLVLFRTSLGRLGLIQERCTHHGVLLAYGHVEEDRLVCPLHGWCFEVDGSCSVVAYQGKVYPMSWARAKSYTVAEYAGLVWAYLGPDPAPPLPSLDVLNRHDGRRITVYPVLDRNWMDVAEGGGYPTPAISSTSAVNSVWLRTPVDDTHTWQLLVETLPGGSHTTGGTGQPEVIHITQTN